MNVLDRVNGLEVIEAESEFGELLLLRTEYFGRWKALDVTTDKYYGRVSENSLNAQLECYRNRCGYQHDCDDDYGNGEKLFHPTTMKIRKFSEKTFPFALFRGEFSKQLQDFQMSNFEISEIYQMGLIGANALTRLDLSHNVLKELPSEAFLYAGNLIELNLSYNLIARMPSDVFKGQSDEVYSTTESPSYHTTTDFSDTTEYEYPSTSDHPKTRIHNQPMQNLKIIRLNNNLLTFIDPSWFRYLRSLENVTLNDNLLTEIDLFSVFHFNFGMKELKLQNNNFSNIITNAFSTKLRSFDISNNPKNLGMPRIDVFAREINISHTNSRECFIPPNAVILHADHNKIKTVSVYDASISNLTRLYLDHNQLDSADFLHGLNLMIIDLSHNQLTQIDANVFENMKDLMSLDISHNKFSTIDLGFIGPPWRLEFLNISNNLLSGYFELDVDANGLIELNIAHNNYSSVDLSLGKHAPNLRNIDLNGNYFDCDELTATILFLLFDHIRAITPIEDAKGKDNVRGIVCHKKKTDAELPNDNARSQDLSNRSYNTVKNDVSKSFDDKLVQLENRLIELIKNVTMSEN